MRLPLARILVVATAAIFGLAFVYDTFPGDDALLGAVRFEPGPWRDFFAGFDIGPVYSLAMVAGLFIVCLVWRKPWEALFVLLILPAQGLAILLPKFLVGRPRPDGVLAGATESFPSGTAATSMLVLGLGIYFIGCYVASPRWRISLQMLLVLAIIAFGIFRMLAGEHYPSDVLGGWLAGGLALLGIARLHSALRRGSSPRRPWGGLIPMERSDA